MRPLVGQPDSPNSAIVFIILTHHKAINLESVNQLTRAAN
jgi:hypothetical protein